MSTATFQGRKIIPAAANGPKKGKIHSQGRTATQEEKQVLAQYSGFGGIKDVLDLGTDKPLDKGVAGLLNRLLDALRTLAGGDEAACRSLVESIKSSVLTAFYTPQFLIDAVAAQIHKTFSANGLQMQSFLEPSAGIGGFLPVAMPGTRSYAFEKDTITGLVLSLLHEDATTVTAGFETIGTQELEHRKFDVIASNIPFGNFRVFDADLWKKGGIYEQATKTIHNYFFVKAMELLSEGGLLAFVTSRGVADTAGNKFVREYLVNHADLISAVRLPDALFMQTSGIEVGSDLLIFQKHTNKAALSAREQMFLQVAKEMYDMNGTMTENANRLFSMPKTVLATDSRIVMNQHGKYVRKHQWLGVAVRDAGDDRTLRKQRTESLHGKTRGLDEKRYIGNVRGADWYGRVPQIKPLCRCGRGFRSGGRGKGQYGACSRLFPCP